MNLCKGTSESEDDNISFNLGKELKTTKDQQRIQKLPSWYKLTQQEFDGQGAHDAFDPTKICEKKKVEKKTTEDFSLLQKRFLICAIDEMINQLVVFGAGKRQYPARVNFQRADVKYKEPRMLSLYDPQTNRLISDSEDQIREIKLQRERELIIKILSLTREELIANASINCIYVYLAMEHEARDEDIFIHESYIENKSKLKKLNQLKRQMEKGTQDFVEMQKERLAKRKASIQQIRKKAVAEMLYHYRWQEARYDLNKETINRQKRKVKQELDDYEHKIDVENRVHQETIKYIEISMQQLLADIDKWTKIYDADVDEIDGKVLRLEGLMEEAKARLELMDETTTEKESLIEELRAEKEVRDKIIAEDRKKEIYIFRIQAWWRGVMVRWEFGHYEEMMKMKYKKIKLPKQMKKKKGKADKTDETDQKTEE